MRNEPQHFMVGDYSSLLALHRFLLLAFGQHLTYRLRSATSYYRGVFPECLYRFRIVGIVGFVFVHHNLGDLRPSERCRIDDRDSPEWIKRQQVCVTGYNHIRPAIQGQFQKLVVLGITTLCNPFRNYH